MKAVWLALAAAPVWAHVVSISSGDLSVSGSRARYELRMPLYEIAHLAGAPGAVLLEHVRFAGARPISAACREDRADNLYVCTADYEFREPPERIDVECTLAAVTSPTHVHVLHAELNGKRDQALFDISFPRATLRFRPPSPAEVAITQAAAGFMRALGGPVQLLFLAALALAARSRREWAALAATFLAGQIVAVLLAPHWQPPARFVEAAAALTVAYLSLEILLLPRAGARWLVAGVLGTIHGLYFHLLFETAGYLAGWVLAGAAVAETLLLGLLALLFAVIGRWGRALRPLQVSACGLLIIGVVWFVLRMRG